MAEDRDLLLAGFAALSGRSRRSRFLRGVSDAQFERMLPVLLDTVDQQSHVALLLYADGRPIGVGRLRRFPSDPSVADLAVTVADDWHGRGAGTVLAQTTARPRRERRGMAGLAGCPKSRRRRHGGESAQPLNRWAPQTHLNPVFPGRPYGVSQTRTWAPPCRVISRVPAGTQRGSASATPEGSSSRFGNVEVRPGRRRGRSV